MVLPPPEISSRIIVAPMAGGPTTPQLVAAVGDAGGPGFLAAGYKTPDDVAQQVQEVRELSGRPFRRQHLRARPPDRRGRGRCRLRTADG